MNLMIIDKSLIASIRWNKELGLKLKYLRGNESMQSFAKRASCAYQLIQHLERGEYPQNKWKKFAAYYLFGKTRSYMPSAFYHCRGFFGMSVGENAPKN